MNYAGEDSRIQHFAWDGGGVLYRRSDACDYAEHAHRMVQVSVTFGRSVVHAKWQGHRMAQGCGRRRTTLGGADACVIPSWQPHTLHWERPSEVISFQLEPQFISRVAGGLAGGDGGDELIENYGTRDPFIHQLGVALRAEFRQAGAPGRLYAESLAVILAAHLLRHYSASAQKRRRHASSGALPPRQLRRAVEYIHARLEHDVSLAEMAEAVGLSPYHFARMFKKATGLAPHQYVVRCRIERARALLVETDLSVAEIADRVGYAHQSHFSTLFRRMTRMTPREYRGGR